MFRLYEALNFSSQWCCTWQFTLAIFYKQKDKAHGMCCQVAEDGLHESLCHLKWQCHRWFLSCPSVITVPLWTATVSATYIGCCQTKHCCNMLVVLETCQHDAKLHALKMKEGMMNDRFGKGHLQALKKSVPNVLLRNDTLHEWVKFNKYYHHAKKVDLNIYISQWNQNVSLRPSGHGRS